jgi:hypothetical protein
VDLGDLEVCVDGGLHRDEIVVTAKAIEECAEVWKRHPGLGVD